MKSREESRFGTFGGVFTPCTLTILGVIMFLRFGQVVGQSGLIYAFVILAASKLITTLTSLSLSAIATNTRVRGGGAYYLISRSLGVRFGSVIGILFFVAQSVSVAMYVIGFTEAFLAVFPALGLSMRTIGTIVNVAVFVCVFVGAGWTIKLQYGILAVLMLSIASFCAGAFSDISHATLVANLKPNFQDGQSLLTMFALFFPAVTGIMAGANMSGDLRDPARSIPRGTLAAVGFTAFIYSGIALLLAASRSHETLIANNLIMKDIAWSPALISFGIFAATLSSALGSMMGAPRILQAFARDRIIRRIDAFSKRSGKSAEPRRATVATFAVAQAAVFVGDLNAIAPIITMFFMVTYGMLNLACFYESITHNPSYRPTFRLSHWSTALLGAVGCGLAMFVIAPLWAIAGLLLMAALHWYIGRRQIQARWGDVSSGIAYERARQALLRLEEERYHPKNWRPTILALSGGAWSRYDLAEYGHWLTAGHGVLALGHIIHGNVEDRIARRTTEERELRTFIKEQELAAFPAVVVEESLLDGIKALLQCYGIGGIRPNTVLLSWSNDPGNLNSSIKILRLIYQMKRSIIILSREDKDKWIAPTGTVDVWWQGRKHGALMLILAHMLVQNPEWRNRAIRVLHATPSGYDKTKAENMLVKLLKSARIEATHEVVVTDNLAEVIQTRSAESAVVLIGFSPPEEGAENEFFEQTSQLISGVSNVLLVCDAGDISLEA